MVGDSMDNGAFELSGYSNIRQIGVGGMATVYSAIQENFQRKVAVKVLLPAYSADGEFAERFLREARTVSQLSHPHIIPVFDFGQRDGVFYMVMEHMPGGDLATWIKRGLEDDEALAIIGDIASALHFAHEKGFVHRDVKPDNVMFREDNSAVLTDFGIARKQSAENQMTVAGQVLGTPRYMSPEQLQGRDLDGRSDIYSLGIMFYEMLCKQTPYQDEDFMALAMMHIQAPIPKLPGKFAKYQKFFERMVAKQPEHRFQTGLEVVKVVQQIRSGQMVAGGVDSSQAAALKQALQTDEGEMAADSAVVASGNVRVPREVMISLQDMDPLLDEEWASIVNPVFSKLEAAERKYIYEQFLKPKGIVYDAQNKKFAFYGRKTVADVVADTIRDTGLQAVAAKIGKTEQTLRTTRDINAFADLMESGLSVIERFNVDDNLNVQKQKLALRSAYLDDLVLLVRNAQFDLPKGRRQLTIEAIKTFIIEVYLKCQMQGYRFKTLHLSKLENDPDRFLSSIVAPEVRIRQCYIIRSRRYMYLVGPVQKAGQDPYSIRRFLQEDTALGGQVIYFNAIAIDLQNIASVEAQEEIAWLISRIVTLERQLSIAIIDLVKSFEKNHVESLRPLLMKELEADGSDIESVIHDRLEDFERKLSVLILGKLPKALLEMAKTNDDFEYLYACFRNLIIELACDVRDFAAQSTSVWSNKAEEMDFRMMSYLRLLDKRKDTLFVLAKPSTPDPATNPDLLMEELKSSLDGGQTEVEALKIKLAEVIQATAKPKGAIALWFEKVTGADKKKITPDMVRSQIEAAMRKTMLSIIRLQKRYPLVTVYLEFEGIAAVNEAQRHYAMASGTEGVGRLPKLLTLQEDRAFFDIDVVRKALLEDVFGGAWRGGTR